jgi:hypothetical protein
MIFIANVSSFCWYHTIILIIVKSYTYGYYFFDGSKVMACERISFPQVIANQNPHI